jgi:hypothetical protein
LGRVAQLHASGDLAPQETLGALQRRQHLLFGRVAVGAAHPHVGVGQFAIDAHVGDGYKFEARVGHFALQQVADFGADSVGHALLAEWVSHIRYSANVRE